MHCNFEFANDWPYVAANSFSDWGIRALHAIAATLEAPLRAAGAELTIDNMRVYKTCTKFNNPHTWEVSCDPSTRAAAYDPTRATQPQLTESTHKRRF